MSQDAERYEFQAKTQKLLDIIINSIYTNREIFLRELISNASDALDKVRFELTQGKDVFQKELPLEIRIMTDEKNKLLIIEDTGVGMTRQEAVENLGTIAHSGTEEFLKHLGKEKEGIDNIIGRFGVGFYSVFMVAREVEVKSRSAKKDARPILWRSTGQGSFEIEEIEEEISRGTRIYVYLKEDATYFLGKEKIKDIILTHSNFIAFPIFVNGEKINTIPALWKEPKFKITKEQYEQFYKFLTNDVEAPLKTLHINVDAPVQFNALLFIPPSAPAMFDPYLEKYGLDLYVNRVLIEKKNQDLIPRYLAFLKGVVDTEDLPLNISRETIQENAVIRKIRDIICKQVLSALEEMAKNDKEAYTKFWKHHGRTFKYGYTDYKNKDRFIELLRFNSSYFGDVTGLTSLQEYLDRMKKDQQSIYYILGDTRQQIEKSPYLETLKDADIEVLYLYDPLDEFVLQAIGSYKNKSLKAVEHITEEEIKKISGDKTTKEKSGEEMGNLLSLVKEILKDKILEVRVSPRLTHTPVCLVNSSGGMSSQMEKILHMVRKDTSIPRYIMEINPAHPIIKKLNEEAKKGQKNGILEESVHFLFEIALLQNGYLPEVNKLAERAFKVLDRSLGEKAI